MYPEFLSLENKMRLQLQTLSAEADPLLNAQKGIAMLSITLQELRTLVWHMDHTNVEAVIKVQKQWIPLIYAEYLFFVKRYHLLFAKPFGVKQKEYLIRASEKIEDWFLEHEDFLRYYRSGQTHLDQQYFVSGMHHSALDQLHDFDLYYVLAEDHFCSVYTFIAAMSLANQRLQKEITLQIIQASANFPLQTSLQWTISKTDLTELIYALYAAAVFNKGKVTIREITRFFEESLQLSLGNTSVTFQEILRRKDSTAFLDRLRDGFERYVDQVEQKNIR